MKQRKSQSKPRTKKSTTRTRKRQAPPRTAEQYFAKPQRIQDLWDRVLNVVSKMRSERISLHQASREAGVSPSTVIRWGGSALEKRNNGRYLPKSSDRLLRLLKIPSADGMREIAVRSSRQATSLGKYWNAVHRYLETGDASRLEKFRGKSIKDAEGVEIPLPTGRAELNRLGSAGVLSFESLYSRTV